MPRKRLNEILTAEVINVSPTTPVSQAIRIMQKQNISCIVILEENKPIGIFTERNVVHSTLLSRGWNLMIVKSGR